jgi:hypothetical protein
MTMPKFIMTFNYSSGTWARMLKVADDRVAAVTALLESLAREPGCDLLGC